MNALFRALAAGFGADAAMFHTHFGVSFTLFRAGRTDVCTYLAKTIYMGTIHHHDLGRGAASSGAFEVKPDTCL